MEQQILFKLIKKNRSLPQRENGMVLILVLWALAILTAIVLSFSYAARTETLSALSFKQGIEKKFLAEAGIERGIMEIIYRLNNPPEIGGRAWKTDGTVYTFETENGYYNVSITDESAKVDINKAPELILKSMFSNTGIDSEQADTIADSIMDWRDEDELHRLHGAESDYYLSLPNPYRAKNSDFETPEELALVKGVTPGILYGGPGQKGIMDFLTVYSGTGKINLNSAPREILLSIPGMSSEIADAVITYRETAEIRSPQEAPGGIYPALEQYVSVSGSNTFTVRAAGFTDRPESGYAIKAVVHADAPDNYTYLYYKSPAGTDIRYAGNTEGQ